MPPGHDTMRDVTVSNESARAAYNRISRWYDMLAPWGENRCRKVGLSLLKAKDGESVLEIGFGTGTALMEIASAVGSSGKAFGIDISDGMHAIAHTKVGRRGLEQRVELIRGDARHPPYQDESFDAVFMCFCLEVFDASEMGPLLQRCKAVLKMDGRICIVGMSQRGRRTLPSQLYEWAHRRFPNVIDCKPIHVERLLQSAGFKIAECCMLSVWGLPVEAVLAAKG
jgi:demethylmenaquinone methyltransferase/2-methoxy-6-polyprenyl-1,4-benzoquinol methylase